MRITRVASKSCAPTQGFDQILRVAADERTRDRFPHAPDVRGVLAAAQPVLRQARPQPAVIQSLQRFNLELNNTAGASAAERLIHPRALVVITGQQPALFGGPLLTLHKCIGAVLLARALEQAHGAPVVPVFWVHSVDHDITEANRVLVPGGGDWRRAVTSIVAAGRCLARVALDEQALAEIGALADALDLPRQLQPTLGETLAHWSTRCLMHLLPPDLGVVLADAHQLMPHCAEFWQRSIVERNAMGEAVATGTARVQALGQEAQVMPRDPLQLFREDTTGARARVLSVGGLRCETAQGAQPTNEQELLALAAAHPDRFSPGVLLRPLLQQWLLPVCAHVNGPAENAYFAQLPELFAAARLPLPALLPRPSLSWVPRRAERWIKQFGVDPESLLTLPSAWPTPAPSESAEQQKLQQAAQALAQLAHDAGATSGANSQAAAFSATIAKATERFAAALEHRRNETEGSARTARHKLSALLHPHSEPQERALSAWAVLGPTAREDIATAFTNFDPFDYRHALVRLGAEELS